MILKHQKAQRAYRPAGLILLLVLVLGAFCGCGDALVTEEEMVKPGTASAPLVREFTSLQDSYEFILNECSAEFIGHHPVDESFLSWFAANYGDDTLLAVAGEVVDNDPEYWFLNTGKSIHVLWTEYCMTTGIEAYELQNTYFPETASPDSLTIEVSGDVNLGEHIATTEFMLTQENGILDCFSPELLSEMESADVLMLNNEYTYTTRGEAIPGKTYTFRAAPQMVDELFKLGCDIVNVANNHVYDYGEIGLLDTLDTLNNAGMPFVGAGHNIDEASKIIYYVAAGRKIALVSATQIERTYAYTKEATETEAGVLKTLHPERYCQVINKAAKNADVVVAIVHWGTEGNIAYGNDQVNLAEAFIDAGADVIVGGHTHCLQAVEYIRDVPVYYSLGNYWFATTSEMPAAYDTGLAKLVIGSDCSVSCGFVPCRFVDGVTSLVTDPEGRTAEFGFLNELSSTATIDENGNITHR